MPSENNSEHFRIFMFCAYFRASLNTRRYTKPRKIVTLIYIYIYIRHWKKFSPANTSYNKHFIRVEVHCSFEESGNTLATFLVFMKHKGLLERPFPRTYPEQINSIFFLTPRLFAFHFLVGFPSTTMSRSFLLFGGMFPLELDIPLYFGSAIA